MSKLFGSSKPKPSSEQAVAEAIASIDQRVKSVEEKMRKMDSELRKYRDQLNKMRDGPSKNMVKQRAMLIVRQKKMYEQQLVSLQQQAFNLEQMQIANEAIKDSRTPIEAMRLFAKTMKEDYKKVDLDKIQDLQEEVEDMMGVADSVQESLGRSYGMPDDVDDSELTAELEELCGDNEDLSYLDAASAPAVPETDPQFQHSTLGGKQADNRARPTLASAQ